MWGEPAKIASVVGIVVGFSVFAAAGYFLTNHWLVGAITLLVGRGVRPSTPWWLS